ncbi:SET domain-containing protein [Amniculicola lignicola CBS 123094]|uniref:SET domain-containing protein n=1 Tax=Amniculicola lignicola CBS 123094 TaxID=1392246 RepID=A0A6A5W5S3_9PLEO|nr:SET domain-containing protein [Amniculicola lignicola CBS 123094]
MSSVPTKKYPNAKALPSYIAPSEICVNTTGERIGEGLFAGDNFGAGELIIAAKRPMVASLDTERLIDTCANCYTWTAGESVGSRLYVKEGTKVSACGGCKRFRYCGKQCQKEAWIRGHKYECKALKPVSERELPKAVLATIELLLRKKHGLIEINWWESLCGLDSHISDFSSNGKIRGIELMAMGTADLTGGAFTKEFAAEMYARVLSNSLTLVTPTFDPLGIMMDPTLSRINHSCDPNVYIVMDGAEAAIWTLKPIERDEELYISYIDTTNPYARRQMELKERWFFTCKCSKCEKENTLFEDRWNMEPKKLPAKWKETADVMPEREILVSQLENYVGPTRDDKRVAILQGKAFSMYEDAQNKAEPVIAIKTIEDGMRLCYQSGLWPVVRQPYAAFRDDLIVNMLSVGNFQIAWSQCAKRHRFIDPILYPQEAHPIRVVHIWQMATLALYIASSPVETGHLPPAVDMVLISYHLVQESLARAEKSHGENSAFALSIKRKHTEMFEEMNLKLGPDAMKIVASRMPQQLKYLEEMGTWMVY